MNFISDWALPILFLLAFADRTAAILMAVLFATARITGPAEAAGAVALGSACLTLLLWRIGLRHKKREEVPPPSACDYTIGQWLRKHGPAGAAARVVPVAGWRFNGTVALASQSGGRPAVCLYAVLFTVLWVLFWILVLMPAAERLMAATTTLTHVRMTLPGLMLLAFTAAVVLRTALCRLHQRYQEKKHENSCR